MKVENPKFNFELVKRFLHISADRPNRVQVEITNRCNLDCRMCPRQDYAVPYQDMSFDFFKEIILKLKGVDLILPVGWGESFIHPDFHKIIHYLREHKHQIKVTTNGLLLNSAELRKTALQIDYLTFSLELEREKEDNYGHSNEQIIDNIKLLIEERKDNKKPYICVQSVLLKNNKDIVKVIVLAKEMGIDRVNLVRPYTKFNQNFASDGKTRRRICRQADKLGRKLGLRVDMFEYASFTGIKRLFWKYGKGIFRINKWCPRLYDFAYVTMEGQVTPCCALPRYIVGDLKEQSLDEIWRGKEMSEFRKKHRAICKDCQVFKIM